jgi:cytochrome c-type biogenesis protein CcmH
VNPALTFIVLAVGLIALVLVVLCVALWRGAQAGALALQARDAARDNPALANAAVYRDQLLDLEREHALGNLNDSELQIARDELSQRLLDDVGPAEADADALDRGTSSGAMAVVAPRQPWVGLTALIVLVPVLSLVMYGLLGQPEALDPLALKQGVSKEAEVTPEKLATMAAALSRRLEDEPNNVEGWVMLARVQRALGQFEPSGQSLRKALALSQDDNLAIDLAEVLAQQNAGNFSGEPWAIIQRVLKADPRHLNGLFLAGSASYTESNYSAALRFWERAREVVAADSPDAPELDRAISEAREKLGLAPAPAAANSGNVAAKSTDAPAAASGGQGVPTSTQAQIRGRVSVAPELAGKVGPQDTVFVYATAVSGSRMPVAIVRTTVAALPFDFVLDDSTAMNPSAKLSSMAEVTVRVRVSKSGQAVPQAGDVMGSVSPVKLGSHNLSLIAKDVQP